jgi:hypothetical protein
MIINRLVKFSQKKGVKHDPCKIPVQVTSLNVRFNLKQKISKQTIVGNFGGSRVLPMALFFCGELPMAH